MKHAEGKEKMWWETGKNFYRRGRNHLDGWKRKEEGNILHEHCQDKHIDRMMTIDDFSMKVTGQYKTWRGFIDSTMKRSREKKIITNKRHLELFDSGSQFYQPKLFKPKPSNIQYDDWQDELDLWERLLFNGVRAEAKTQMNRIRLVSILWIETLRLLLKVNDIKKYFKNKFCLRGSSKRGICWTLCQYWGSWLSSCYR